MHRSTIGSSALLVGATLTVCSCSGSDAVSTEQPNLRSLAGYWAIQRFELWSTVDPVTLLYEAVGNGYAAVLRINASSDSTGTYSLTSTGSDPLGVNDDDSGTLVMIGGDSLRFQGEESLPGSTHFEIGGPQLTLTNPYPHVVTLSPGPIPVTTRVVLLKTYR